MGQALGLKWGAPHLLEHGVSSSTDPGGTVLDATGEYISCCFVMDGNAGATDSITHIGYRQGTVTGTPTDAYDIGIMDPDATGFPDGTFDVSTTFTPSAANDGKVVWVAITPTVLNSGQPYFIVLRANAGASGANFMTAVGTSLLNIGRHGGPPYGVTSTASPNKVQGTLPAMACKSATRIYGGFPANSWVADNAYGSTTAENALIYTLPTDFCATYKIGKVRYLDFIPVAGAGTRVVTIYTDPLGTPVLQAQSSALDNDLIGAASSGFRVMEAAFTGPLVTLTAGVPIAIGFSRTDATGNLYTINVEAVGDFDSWAFGQQCSFGTRNPGVYPPVTGAPAFTQTLTKRPWVELVLAEITQSGGGGGGDTGGMKRFNAAFN